MDRVGLPCGRWVESIAHGWFVARSLSQGLAFPKISDYYEGPTDVYGPAKLKFKQTWNEVR